MKIAGDKNYAEETKNILREIVPTQTYGQESYYSLFYYNSGIGDSSIARCITQTPNLEL